MPIEYINGSQLFHAFSAGSRAIFRQTEELNRINVFPVADGDTGTNLSMTMKSIIESIKHSESFKHTISSLADSALMSAQGNSGIIFAQYLLGFNDELGEHNTIDVRDFAQAAQKAVKHVYNALLNPVEGTMLTVIKDWADSLIYHSEQTKDFSHLIPLTMADAQNSLLRTPKQLKVLADAGVLDAGAQGFVHFLEGVYDYIKSGCKHKEAEDLYEKQVTFSRDKIPTHSVDIMPEYRYCTECILTNCSKSLADLKQKYRDYGDSLILAGNKQKLHMHIHSNIPDQLFYELSKEAEISKVKADDMLMQYNIVNHRKHKIGLMSDTAADLPQHIIEEYQIMQVPFGINFPNNQFLDKYTIQPDEFYKLLKQEEAAPTSSLPALKTLDSAMNFLETQYEKSICLHISSGLSATFQASFKQAENHPGIIVKDSRHLSVTEGLLLLRTARVIEAGMPFEQIITQLDEWVKKTFIYTDIATLKYMVRSGRVSPMKGLMANILNIKPIVSVDDNGKGIAYGKSFSRKANMNKILKIISSLAEKKEIWEYAIVHSAAESRANKYAEKLTSITCKAPVYVMPLSPVIGVHNGIGAVAIGISLK